MVRNKILAILAGILIQFGLIVSPVHASDDKLIVERLGDVGQIALPLTALAMPYYEDDKKASIRFAKEYTTTFVITHILKFAINEERPNGGDLSFPSGHTSSAFAGAVSLHERYGWKWGLPAYAAASFVGFSRVYADKHWPHDVVAGAALAIAVNRYFSYRTKKQKIKLLPFIERQTTGLVMQAHW